ncbi:probable RNA-binding protein EIF1AD [Drosophila madeirensis]|uniref:Probable RNA-binding protein EIF1AD n=2 Tax=obscura subgroup TaxID=32357 RepID=A0A3B0JAH1_DROGU|nr:probable RNA-binding protein EIF1AD [Drosophila guanche]SPP78975.1 blast:Centrosomal protein of 97 kDa [Drosophila guanche]
MHRSHPSTTRRKHLIKEMMEDDYELPTEQQQIVRVVSSRGNNLHEVEPATPESENFLVSMPNKYRKNMWVKRGDFLLVEPIEEGDKVKAEISKILTNDHVKEYTKAGIWPERFAKNPPQAAKTQNDDEDSDFEDDLTPNTNRPVQESAEEDDDEDEETESSEDED